MTMATLACCLLGPQQLRPYGRLVDIKEAAVVLALVVMAKVSPIGSLALAKLCLLKGAVLYSAGTDGLVKAASSSTGQVTSKFAIPPVPSTSAVDPPSILYALSPQMLLLGTDSAALHLCDLRSPSLFASLKPAQTHRPHDDYISSLTPLPPSETSTSNLSKQWVTTGGSTLAVTDLRRGVLVKSEDQEVELLSSVFVGGLPSKPGRRRGEKVLVGGGNGVLTLWERGVWDDQDERIIVDPGRGGGESLDALAVIPPSLGDGGRNVVVGVGDGTIRIVQLGLNKVVGEWLQHDGLEGVAELGFDIGGRMISGGGRVVKVWQKAMGSKGDAEDGDEDQEDDGDEPSAAQKHNRQVLDSPDADEMSDEEDSGGRGRRKRRRGGKRRKGQGAERGNGVFGIKGID